MRLSSYEEFLKSNGLKDGERMAFNKGIKIATGHLKNRRLARARAKFDKIMSTCAARFSPKDESEALQRVRRRDAGKLAGIESPFYLRDVADMEANGFTAREIFDISAFKENEAPKLPSKKKVARRKIHP